MKKAMLVLLCIVMAGMVLTGCASGNASGTTATAAPIVTNSPMATDGMAGSSAGATNGDAAGMVGGPGMVGATGTVSGTGTNGTSGATGAAGATGADTNGAAGASGASGAMSAGTMNAGMTPAQAGRTAEQIEEAVERLSEIDDAEVVIDSGNRVVVAVEFDDQYSAGLDERMKRMIVEAVQKVDDGLTDVQITDDSTLYGQVKGLGERLAKATGLDELASDFGDLWDRITGR